MQGWLIALAREKHSIILTQVLKHRMPLPAHSYHFVGQYFGSKTQLTQQGDYRFGIHITAALYAQDAVAIGKIEVGQAIRQPAMDMSKQLLGLLGVHYVGFKYFYHTL